MRKTKIVATLGPASSTPQIMRQLLKAGINVARFNFSHGTHESHQKMMDTFRAVRDEMNIPAAVLLDTKGPEIRTREFPGGPVTLEAGQSYTLTTQERNGDSKGCQITYRDLPRQLKEGDRVLIDDGKVALKVNSTTDTDILCTVVQGGPVTSHKGINLPHISLDMPYLSEQDKSDLLFGIEQDVDFVAASFVRRRQDVIDLRRFLDYHGGHNIKIISKIENMEGIDNFDAILKESDGIMVARGDMGVEVDYEKLPGLQKRFIRKCYAAGKMAITATQMLESMVHSPVPTRAEITDVANAVFDGTSAVMLSGESANGEWPVKAVEVMACIAEQAEKDAFEMDMYKNLSYENDFDDTTNAICDAACTTARDLRAKAIIAVTKYGQTARRMSKFRPAEPIVAATPVKKAFHQLSLSWGVYPVLALNQNNTDDLFRHAIDCAVQLEIVEEGDLVVISAGVPLSISGRTNILKVQTVTRNDD